LELSHEAFWRLTYYEFSLLLDGYRFRRRQQRDRDAGLLVNLLQPHYKKRLKLEDFLPKPKKRLSVNEREVALMGALGQESRSAKVAQQAEGLKRLIDKKKQGHD
jgi:hypothetical protein